MVLSRLEKSNDMTIGAAIVIVMCLYLLDKHGLLKRAVGVAGILSALALAWIFGQQQYRKWEYARYTRHHAEMRGDLISKYHNMIPAPPAGFKPAPQVQWDDEQRKPAAQSVPTLDPSEVEFEINQR